MVSRSVITGRENFAAMLHQAQRFPIALGFRHPEVAKQLLLGIAAFLLADDHHGTIVEPGGPGHDGVIVAIGAVAVQFFEIREQALDVIERVGTLGMPRQLHAFPAWIGFSWSFGFSHQIF